MFYQSVVGVLAFTAVAWLISENRRAVSWKNVFPGILAQLAVAWILLKVPMFQEIFARLNELVLILQDATAAGTSFAFGYVGGGLPPFQETHPGNSFILAFQALPLVLVVSALSALLFYWRILPLLVRGFSWLLQKSMGIGGVEGLGLSANVFVGMVESPLLIRPYLKIMTRSELFTLMTCGMATIAGTVMVLYAGILSGTIPGVMGHILTASIISVPASVTVSKLMVPETGRVTSGRLTAPKEYRSSMDAVTKGTVQGVELLINIIGMLVVLVALVHLVNALLGFLPHAWGREITLQRILGMVMAPIVWLMGVPWSESTSAGALMGTKTVLNELLAYLELSRLEPGTLSPRSQLIMTYAMCGFANPGSLGIMIGGMGTMAPSRREEIVGLGVRSIVAGTLATCMTGAVVGLMV